MNRSKKAPKAITPPARMLIGYARVSTEDQDLRRQIDALKAAGCDDDHIYTDKKSGATMRRKGLEAALLDARPGDVLIAVSVDRLSRSIRDLIHIAERLNADGIELRILDKQIDTTSTMGRAFFHIMAMFAELERGMIADRTRDGMAAAKRRGRKFGPAPTFGPKQIKQAIRMFKAAPKGKPLSAEAVGKHFGVTGQVVRDKIVATTGRKLWKPKLRKRAQ